MKLMNLVSASLLALSASFGMAHAADMIDGSPQAPEANFEAAAKTGWAGAYGGLYGGYGKGNFGDGVDVDGSGFQGGAFAGANGQSGSIVYGVDGDVGYGGAKGTAGAVIAKKKTNGALRARLGYDLGPALVYGAAGGTMTSAKASDGAVDDSKLHLGYTVGAGVDIKATDRVFVRGEYRYNKYGSKTYDLTAPTDVNLTQHEARIGVGVQF